MAVIKRVKTIILAHPLILSILVQKAYSISPYENFDKLRFVPSSLYKKGAIFSEAP